MGTFSRRFIGTLTSEPSPELPYDMLRHCVYCYGCGELLADLLFAVRDGAIRLIMCGGKVL